MSSIKGEDMSAQPEGRLVKRIVDSINKLPQTYCEKQHGTPYGHCKLDVSGAVNGMRFELEVKIPGNKPTKRQLSTIKKWQKVGVLAGWADSVEEALEFLKPLTGVIDDRHCKN